MAMNEIDMNPMPDEAGLQMTMQMQELMQPTGEQQQDPIEIIKADHRKVENLFKQFEGTKDKRQKLEIAKQICLELKVHAQYEEELVYPLLKKEEEDTEEEAQMEHVLIKFMVSEVEGLRDKTLDPKMKVLKELVEHHVEEEEKEALPELEDNEELQSRAGEILSRKEELKAQFSRGAKKTTRRKSATRKSSSSGRKSASTKSRAKSVKRNTSAKKSTTTSAKKAAVGRKGGKVKAASRKTKSTSRKRK